MSARACRRRRRLSDARTPAPPVPVTLADTGLTADQVEQLLVKTLYAGEATGLPLAERMRLPYAILEPIIERLRAERLIEVRGAAGIGTAELPVRADRLGPRARARSTWTSTSTSAPAPVPLAAYVARDARAGGGPRLHRSRAAARRILAPRSSATHVLEQLGPAVNANKAVFLYGPPGNGKTVIAEGHGRGDRRRHVHAVRHRRRRPDHHDVRPDQPRVARRPRAAASRASADGARATAAGCASGGRSSWSAASSRSTCST